MTILLSATATALVGVAVVLALLAGLATRRLGVALPVMLDLLLAAGLLRLTALADWGALASTAAIVVIRKLAVTGLLRHPPNKRSR